MKHVRFILMTAVFMAALQCLSDEADFSTLRDDSELRGLKIVLVKRSMQNFAKVSGRGAKMESLGFPSNHECCSALKRSGFINEIILLDTDTGKTRTIFKPDDESFVGHIDLHWDSDRILFARSHKTNWRIWEIKLDGTGLRQVSQTPEDVDCFEPCYLPDGRIIVASNAPYQCVPCWHGVEKKFVANLYVMNSDGSSMRRLCFDQDHDTNPSVRNNGQVIYSRWDYTGINRLFLRPLMSMNPDGSFQRAIYGSNSWFPNGLYSVRELPGTTGKFLCILSGYHGSYKTGHLVIVDINRGFMEEHGIVQRISGRGLPLDVRYVDRLTENDWPKFITPCPINDSQFLVSAQMENNDNKMGIYLADTSDKLNLLYEIDGYALLEPIPLIKRNRPPAIPDRVDLALKDAIVYLQDIYVGAGLQDVPRGVVKQLRIIAYNFGYIGLAGTDKIGLSGPWDAMMILGTTPVEEDGSAIFRVPANTPVAFQALDRDGKAVQLMRTWFTAMPGESVSCIGCHESPSEVPLSRRTIASSLEPRELKSWYGPARGFDFAREVQPVLNKYCVSCHDGHESRPDLRPEEKVPDYAGLVPGRYDSQRMHSVHRNTYGGKVRYTPAYEALINYIRRVNVGDDVSVLNPGHYHADTSEMVQLLQQGHHGVRLDEQAWSRLVTWIDLNGPCHGTWQDVFKMPVPGNQHERRMQLAQLYGDFNRDPELVPETPVYDETPVKPDDIMKSLLEKKCYSVPSGHWTVERKEINLGNGVKIELVRVPSATKSNDPEIIQPPFWMSAREISNEQYRQYAPSHNSGYYTKRHEDRGDDKGMSLNGSRQPALRVSWKQAVGFCDWLTEKTGEGVSLPDEDQWEYACSAGSKDQFFFGAVETDFSIWANMADRTFATFGYKGITKYFQLGGDVDYIAAEGVKFADQRFDDGGCVTMPAGSYRANAFGLYDMHGNAAEWTLTDISGEKVVKGGSYLDRPARCSVSARYLYPSWQKVYNVGFRIVFLDPVLRKASTEQ